MNYKKFEKENDTFIFITTEREYNELKNTRFTELVYKLKDGVLSDDVASFEEGATYVASKLLHIDLDLLEFAINNLDLAILKPGFKTELDRKFKPGKLLPAINWALDEFDIRKFYDMNSLTTRLGVDFYHLYDEQLLRNQLITRIASYWKQTRPTIRKAKS